MKRFIVALMSIVMCMSVGLTAGATYAPDDAYMLDANTCVNKEYSNNNTAFLYTTLYNYIISHKITSERYVTIKVSDNLDVVYAEIANDKIIIKNYIECKDGTICDYLYLDTDDRFEAYSVFTYLNGDTELDWYGVGSFAKNKIINGVRYMNDGPDIKVRTIESYVGKSYTRTIESCTARLIYAVYYSTTHFVVY